MNKKQKEYSMSNNITGFDNICHYIPHHYEGDKINTLHYVLETKPQTDETFKCLSMNRLHLVTKGAGKLHTASATYELNVGDLFFILPAMPYTIESTEEFQFAYISYLGARGNALMDKLKISSNNCFFSGFSHLCDMWLQGLNVNEQVSDIRSESILLYTFSALGDVFLTSSSARNSEDDLVTKIQQYIDDHLSDTDLSLQLISKELLYNQKYLSTAFKKAMKIGISEYITTLRIQQALALMNQGFTSIKDISSLCGFKDPLYFSKVFSKRLGMSPKKYQESM